MNMNEEADRPGISTSNSVKYARLFACFLIFITGLALSFQTANANTVDCSSLTCTSTDQQAILGHSMFNESNFDAIVDGLGRTRKFWVHIPVSYDTLSSEQKMPVIFAFHGHGGNRSNMLTGKWGDLFDQDTAFVIPLADFGPCDTSATPKRVWLGPFWGEGVPFATNLPADCDPATQQVDSLGAPVTYFDASMSDTFTDVLFIENLRATILDRFSNLNSNKVYATGFSNGGGLAYSLLCYRASLFRGFSVVANTLFDDRKRGDFDKDGIVETDVNSLVATCGKTLSDSGHATGLTTPNLWGRGRIQLPLPIGLPSRYIFARQTKPIALFVGDHDPGYTQQEIDDTITEIKTNNNLGGFAFGSNPYLNLQPDDALTEMFTTSSAANYFENFSAFRKYLVKRTGTGIILLPSADHAMPDAEECPSFGGAKKMTCDYSYTTETKRFFESYADLNLNP